MEQDDRDLLIRVDANLLSFKESTEKWQDQNQREHDKMMQRLDCVTEKRVPNKLFYWTMGIIVACILGAYGFTQVVNADLSKHQRNTSIHIVK